MAKREEQKNLKALYWDGDRLGYIDQRELPENLKIVETDDFYEVVDAIKELKIRGAPLIGVATVYALALRAKQLEKNRIKGKRLKRELFKAGEILYNTRPTAVNLKNALERVNIIIEKYDTNLAKLIIQEGQRLEREETERSFKIAQFGVEVVPKDAMILTICNTGFLAAPGFGTALAVIRAAFREGKVKEVFALETRPLLQGARLTMWELKNLGIPATLVTDSMAAPLMARGKINFVITGADRIATNGDVANKIGTLSVALAAQYFDVPFYVAAPLTSFDPNAKSGRDIPIEERDPEEVTNFRGVRIAPVGVDALNYAFDVTPNVLISGIITEEGILYPPFEFTIPQILSR